MAPDLPPKPETLLDKIGGAVLSAAIAAAFTWYAMMVRIDTEVGSLKEDMKAADLARQNDVARLEASRAALLQKIEQRLEQDVARLEKELAEKPSVDRARLELEMARRDLDEIRRRVSLLERKHGYALDGGK